MRVTKDKAPDGAINMVTAMMFEHHKDLHNAGVTVEVLFASKLNKDEEPEPPMMVRGHQALAKISITSDDDRLLGIADAKLVIDAVYGWDRQTEARRQAIIDHELTHLELVRDKDDQIKVDDHGRPKLKIRHHDWELTGFAEVCERHGEAAIEAREMTRWAEQWGQFALFPLRGTTEVKVKSTAPVKLDA